jgi:hypothetical protein
VRVTIDVDSHNPFRVFHTFIKGVLACRKLPYLFRWTSRGYHFAWRGMHISNNEMYRRRVIIGDDFKRVRLDMFSPLKPKQVLFTSKTHAEYKKVNGIFVKNILSKR